MDGESASCCEAELEGLIEADDMLDEMLLWGLLRGMLNDAVEPLYGLSMLSFLYLLDRCLLGPLPSWADS